MSITAQAAGPDAGDGHPPDYLSSFFGAAPTRNGLKDLYLFACTGVLNNMPDDDAFGAGVGALVVAVMG